MTLQAFIVQNVHIFVSSTYNTYRQYLLIFKFTSLMFSTIFVEPLENTLDIDLDPRMTG